MAAAKNKLAAGSKLAYRINVGSSLSAVQPGYLMSSRRAARVYGSNGM